MLNLFIHRFHSSLRYRNRNLVLFMLFSLEFNSVDITAQGISSLIHVSTYEFLWGISPVMTETAVLAIHRMANNYIQNGSNFAPITIVWKMKFQTNLLFSAYSLYGGDWTLFCYAQHYGICMYSYCIISPLHSIKTEILNILLKFKKKRKTTTLYRLTSPFLAGCLFQISNY